MDRWMSAINRIWVDIKDSNNGSIWRSSYLIEYHGEADLEDVDPQCQQDVNTTVCSYVIFFLNNERKKSSSSTIETWESKVE